ncbi:MAG: hypothetical protein ACM37W_20540 [Actinomycetota bacterium]
MVTQPTHSQPCLDLQTQAELELLEAIVQADIPYAWNPAQPESEAYLTTLEQEFSVSDCLSDTEAAKKSQLLFAQLDELWSTTALKKSLLEKFSRVPEELLTCIVQRVKNLTVQSQSLAEQMVQCVLEVLPQWGEEDLQVLARPLAYAMRDAESETMELAVTAGKYWAELSEIEKARASLAIARYAISQFHHQAE